MNRRVVAVVPMKDLANAKSRLRGVLSPEARALFARNLFERLAGMLVSEPLVLPTLVVTPSEEIAGVAASLGCKVLLEPAPAGLNAAARAAASWSEAEGYRSQLLIHADLPRIETRDIVRILKLARPHPSVVVAPSRDLGANLLLTTPPHAVPFRFGQHSSVAFRKAAVERGIPFTIVWHPRLAWDIDLPTDLLEFQAEAQCVKS